MKIYEELEKAGYKFDREYGCPEDRAEVWINKEAGMAVHVEWSRLEGW